MVAAVDAGPLARDGRVILEWIRALTAGLLRLSMKSLPRGPHITRFSMYRHLSRFRQSPRVGAKVLSISHSKHLCEVLGLDRQVVTEANYPEANMLSLLFADGSFDYVVSDQVLEHVEGDPQVAIDETLRVLRPGGIAIHATCFINPIHEVPGDFWRFTPGGAAIALPKVLQDHRVRRLGESLRLGRRLARAPR